jgi:hypothetical protein
MDHDPSMDGMSSDRGKRPKSSDNDAAAVTS